METVDRGGPGPATSKKRRSNVGKACNNCRRRKSRCDGQQPECKTCQIYNDECTWGEVEDGRKPASRQYVNTLKNRIAVLESYIKDKGQQLPSPGPAETFDSIEDEAAEDTPDGVATTMLHLRMGEAGEQVHFYGPTSAFAHSSRDPTISASPVEPKIGEFMNRPHDYSRYLPNDVELAHAQHTIILDRFFRFFASWGMRALPDLFHQDMIRTVMLPPNTPLARFTHYSPFLHNILLAIALMWADEDYLRETSTRAIFAAKAETYLSIEISRPTLATVQGLALKSSYHSTLGDHAGGWSYFGLADRASLSLGLNLSCTALVDAGRMSKSEMLMRRNAFWCIFIQEQCWSVYIGRPHESQAYSTSLPTVDEQLDEMPWRWDTLESPDSDLPPQSCMFSTAFVETAKLSLIMQRIMTTLYSIKSDVLKLQKDSTITDLGLALDSWTEQLPPPLVVNGHTMKNALPHIIMLQLAREWCTILIYRPYYRPVAQMAGTNRATGASSESLQNLAVRRCDRSAARINSLLRTYHQRFGLRYSPPTLFNIAFTAGTTHLLSAVRHHGTKVRDGAVTSARECVDFLNSVAESWPAAGHKADILDTLVREYHPHTYSTAFEESITLTSASVSSMRPPAESKTSQPQPIPAQLATHPIPVQQQQQQPTYTNQDSLFTSGSFSSDYSEAPWQFSTSVPSMSRHQPQSFSEETMRSNWSSFDASLPANDSASAQVPDPFLLSLLNHITLPPHVPQSTSSPNDLYMPRADWSPQANLPLGQMSNTLQYTSEPLDSMSSYLHQAQSMSLTPAPQDNRYGSIGTSQSEQHNVQNRRSGMDKQWNGYFGSS